MLEIVLSAESACGTPIVSVNGVKPPAWVLAEPAVKDGVNGGGFGHGVPPGPEVIWKGLEAGTVTASGFARLPDQGVNDARVSSYVPHDGGVVSDARGPPKSSSFSSSNDASGVFANVDSIWPVGPTLTSPASLTSTFETGSCATMYIANSEPNGLSFCLAR